MSKIMLDMATLRAAKKVLHPETARPSPGANSNLDLVALSTLVEAIVLFDQILVPNLGHRKFNETLTGLGEGIQPLPLDDHYRDGIASAAIRWLENWLDLEDYIRLLGSHSLDKSFDLGSNDYMLLQFIGVKNKYESQVVQWVRTLNAFDHFGNQAAGAGRRTIGSDYIRGEIKKIFDQHQLQPAFANVVDNKRTYYSSQIIARLLERMHFPAVNMGYSTEWFVDRETLQFCANLVWTVFRAACYELVSQAYGTAYMPHPLRARFTGFAAAARGKEIKDYHPEYQGEGGPLTYMSIETWRVQQYLGVMEKVYQEVVEKVSNYLSTHFMPLPNTPLLPYILKNAGKRENVLEVAYDLRESRGARDLRTHLSKLEGEIQQGNLLAAVRLNRELEKLASLLRQQIGLEAGTTPKIALSFGSVLSLDFPEVLIPEALKVKQITIKPRLLFLRNVFDELVRVGSLGALYEVLYPVE